MSAIAPWIAVAVVVLVTFGVVHTWRLRLLRRQHAELLRLVWERTQELEEANRTLAQLSYLDAVTGVWNRRSLEDELTMEWRRSMRTGSRLSLLMIDVDDFKAFNDALGHQAGDSCLRQVAAVIDGVVQRAGDVVARYGGEEFAVLLPDTDAPGAAALAERIRAAIEASRVPHPATQRHLTVSVGVATLTGREDSDGSAIVRAADRALYRAKEDGRNLVRVAAGMTV